MNGGYYLVDCLGIDLTETDPQSITGIWDKAVEALKTEKPIIAHNCVYGTGKKVSPVTCFGWQIASDEIVIVGATLHIHVKDNDTATVLDVAQSSRSTKK